MFRSSRGEYGYIRKKKRNELLFALLMLCIGLAIYVVGYFITKETKNVGLIMGMLMVLPGAKFFTTFLVLFPYRTPEKETYEKAVEAAGTDGILWSDLVITSTEKVMNLDFLYMGNQCVYALAGKTRMDAKMVRYCQEYLTKGVRNWGSSYTVKVYESGDSFLRDVANAAKREADAADAEKVEAYLRSLIL